MNGVPWVLYSEIPRYVYSNSLTNRPHPVIAIAVAIDSILLVYPVTSPPQSSVIRDYSMFPSFLPSLQRNRRSLFLSSRLFFSESMPYSE